jgi:glutathione S-transferase
MRVHIVGFLQDVANALVGGRQRRGFGQGGEGAHGGQQFADAFRAMNPAALVPVLQDEGIVLTQSLAIIEYLDETRPQPPLLPADAVGRARVRAIALAIAAEEPAIGISRRVQPGTSGNARPRSPENRRGLAGANSDKSTRASRPASSSTSP